MHFKVHSNLPKICWDALLTNARVSFFWQNSTHPFQHVLPSSRSISGTVWVGVSLGLSDSGIGIPFGPMTIGTAATRGPVFDQHFWRQTKNVGQTHWNIIYIKRYNMTRILLNELYEFRINLNDLTCLTFIVSLRLE